MSSEDINDAGTPGLGDPSNIGGKKRRRDSDPDEANEERPTVRVKTEPDENGKTRFEDEAVGSVTPLLPLLVKSEETDEAEIEGTSPLDPCGERNVRINDVFDPTPVKRETTSESKCTSRINGNRDEKIGSGGPAVAVKAERGEALISQDEENQDVAYVDDDDDVEVKIEGPSPGAYRTKIGGWSDERGGGGPPMIKAEPVEGLTIQNEERTFDVAYLNGAVVDVKIEIDGTVAPTVDLILDALETTSEQERTSLIDVNHTADGSRVPVTVKAEPGESLGNQVKVEGCGAANVKIEPKVSKSFTSTSVLVPNPLATSSTRELKHQPQAVPAPVEVHYRSHKPEEELNYGGNDGDKIKTIPLFIEVSQAQNSENSEGENSEQQDSDLGRPQYISRHLRDSHVYSKYDFRNRKVDATKLGVHEKKLQILNSLEKARVIIIEGFTGCGKTTQVPQYILDKCFEAKKMCNIVVTQPRKIAAISVARRVCYERGWNMGSVVGYQVGMQNTTDRKDTLLTFMTTGVLLQKLIASKSLKGFTHIIIDEVHERDLESDFLLLVIKKIMSADTEGKQRHVKLIFMSATIDTRKFEDYFVFKGGEEELRPHVIKIPFVPRHNVEELYLNQLLHDKPDQLQLLDGNMETEKAMIQEEIYDICVSCIVSLDDNERQNNPDPRLRNIARLPEQRGSVLVFLPGMEEIKRLQRALERTRQENMAAAGNGNRDTYRWVILPLHSSVSAEEQSQVFEAPTGDGFRKIILSTNIAESSVTVPDISYVIDFCLTKSLCVDGLTNFTTLRMAWAAKSQCTQRKGRTGRVADGKVFRLVSEGFYRKLVDEIQPEMQRSNLETVVLMCKKFNLDSPINLLKDALDRPRISGIQRAVSTLKEWGALTIELKNRMTGEMRYTDDDGDLTFVGKVMTDLPIPQQCTRLILMGHSFGVMQEALIIAAGVSVKSLFHTGYQKQLDTYLEKMKHAKKSFSDLFALYYVYKFWIRNFCESGGIPGERKNFGEYAWAKGAMVHLPVLREIKSTVELLEQRLKKFGITDSYTLPASQNDQSIELSAEQGLFLKLAIAGAFYPHYFLQTHKNPGFEKQINKEVCGYDVFRTVVFTGFPASQQGQLYAKHVADYLAYGASVPFVKFDKQKVLAIFDNSTGDTIGPFNAGIFRAIKLRQLRTNPLEFRVLWKEEESREIARWETMKRQRQSTEAPPLRALPPVFVREVTVRVMHTISPAQFWVVLDRDFEKLRIMTELIHGNTIPIPLPASKLHPNSFCLAPFACNGLYYRAKVLRTDNPANPNAKSLVHFVDYGNSRWVASSCLFDFSPYLVEKGLTLEPCMAIECRLKELRPNSVYGPHWSSESVDFMNMFCTKAPYLNFEIFSIHQSVMIGELVGCNAADQSRCSLNDLLLSDSLGKLFGEHAPEPYLSMENRRKRCRASMMDGFERQAVAVEQIGDVLDLDFIEPPTNGRIPVTLKGPSSPLEIQFDACVKCGNSKNVRVENSSVNSVLLDHEPSTSNPRMLVASHVSVTRGDACMVRDNTVMPAIPGILSLVAMIFSPKVELRVDRERTKYTGLVCGCGTVPVIGGSKLAVHPDNTMEIIFDTEIDDEDIDRVNSIRYYLNLILRSSHAVNRAEYHKLVRENVIKLLRKKRNKIEDVWPEQQYVWDRINPEFLQTTLSQNMVFEHDDIYLPHQKVLLNQMEREEVAWDGVY